jgi:periplasmic protein TonB
VAAIAPPPQPASAPVALHPRRHDPPEFPGRALRARILEGRVLARLWITPEGAVEQVDIVNANPTRVFDDEVRRALSLWTFDPPGHPVTTTVELTFKP